MYFSSKHTFRSFAEESLAVLNYKAVLPFNLGRDRLTGFFDVFLVYPGDVMEVFFFKKGSSFIFEGLCLGVRRKGLVHPESSIILRSFVSGIGIECIFSYYYNRLYSLRMKDYKNRSFGYMRAKFYFLRDHLKRGFDYLRRR